MRASIEEENCQTAIFQALVKRDETDAGSMPDIQESHGRFRCGGGFADVLMVIPKHEKALKDVVSTATNGTTKLAVRDGGIWA